MSLSLLMQSYYPSLTKSEKKVADYLLKMKQDEIMYITLSSLANKAHVGEATVLRFCNKIGCDKFPSLKLLLAKEAEAIHPDTFTDLRQQLSFSTCQIIQDTAKLLTNETVKSAVDMIEKAKQIYFFGVGASGLSAIEAQGNFLRLGKQSIAVTDSHFQTMQASFSSFDDLIIAFSLTGNTKDIYDALLLAKENKTKIIVITNYIESPVARLADVILLTAAKENLFKGGSLSATFSQLFVIDVLKQEYYARHEKEMKEINEKTAKAIVQKYL